MGYANNCIRAARVQQSIATNSHLDNESYQSEQRVRLYVMWYKVCAPVLSHSQHDDHKGRSHHDGHEHVKVHKFLQQQHV